MRNLDQHERNKVALQKAQKRGTTWFRHAKRWLTKTGAATLAVVLIGSLGWAHAQPAEAATVYEIEGEWAEGTPNSVASGEGVVSVWRFNINDDEPAPSNDPVDNVTVTFSAEHAKFTELPSVCLIDNVDPVSAISADDHTLTCNLGTRDQGTAELMLTGMEAAGATGDLLSVRGSIGETEAPLPELSIENEFRMDMKFDDGNPSSTNTGDTQSLTFPFSLRHSTGSVAGPNSVSYDLTFTPSVAGQTLSLSTPACTTQNRGNAGYPYSESGHDARSTAPAADSCALTSLGTNQYRLTLNGIDYSKTQVPTHDTAGNPLPAGWDVVAAGLIHLEFTYADAVVFDFTATAPSYTSVEGDTSVDDSGNNSNGVASTRGVWTGGWQLNHLPDPMPGAIWKDTFRTMAGQPARSVAGVRPPNPGSSQSTQVCSVIDSKYVDFEDAAMGSISAGVVTPYDGIEYWYYTGTGTSNNMNPNHANYNPNTFTCEGNTGWTTTKPANLNTVRAVKAVISPTAGSNIEEAVARMYLDTQVKDDVAVGQDIWTWTSYTVNGGTSWYNPHRDMSGNPPGSGVVTPGSRYPFTGGGRDVMRIIAATPTIEKIVDQQETIPGATLNYTITYRAEAPVSAIVPEMIIRDVLPDGLEYVEGSASPAPTSVNGQTLTWTFENVQTNTDYVITVSARITDEASPGDTFRNTVTAAIAGQEDDANAATRVRDGGHTMLTKTAAATKVPHNNGVAEDSWTVRLSSQDTRPQSFTDTVDILPFNGDGRGTSFSGSYVLSEPISAVAGATVYYTTADPTTLVDDPAHVSNGGAGNVSGNTVGWTTTFNEAATAVRVIGPALNPSQTQEFTISVATEGASHEDTYVNRAEARSDRTELVMRTSSRFEIGAVNSVALKKYVQDAEGEWRDANDVDDYPEFHTGSTLTYRLVVTNTGDQTLTDLAITDDKVDLGAMSPLPVGLEEGALIPELLPGEENAVFIEYEVPLLDRPTGEFLVNTACVAPTEASQPDPEEDYVPTPVEESCDPAGVIVLPSTLTWEKVAAETSIRLEGSEWQITPVDADNEPTGDPVVVTDCVADAADDCDGPDVNPKAGVITINPLEDGRYRVVETRAPAGYQLDTTPHFIDVQGETSFEQAIENKLSEVPELPLTGGLGSFSFWLGSGVLGILAVAGIFWQRRRLGAL